jgi:hypothetical protein
MNGAAKLRAVFASVLIIVLSQPAMLGAQRPPNPTSATDSLLAHYVGHWRMAGEVRGHPVVYELRANPVLGGKYVELHMIDSVDTPSYEARVFIGADTTAGRIVVHWLDNTGAAFSVPPGYGVAAGDTVRFDLAYPTGTFRDTFIYRPAEDVWDMTLVSRDARTGAWRPFAHYTARRVR